MKNFTVPILFIIFNRPEQTDQVFAEIKKNKPTRLFIAADGPRHDKLGEYELCDNLRKNILTKIDWPCEVKTLFRDRNLGCKMAVSSAIDWFFKNVENGIILEDDCLPNQSFFKYCAKMLERYSQQDNIFMISGNNFLPDDLSQPANYYFSRIPHIWGWATWRRAWQKYDVTMSDWPDFSKNNSIKNIWKKKNVQKYWSKIFKDTYEGNIDTWDYQWNYAIWKNNGLSVVPDVNLVSNIGFGTGTHTLKKNSIYAALPTFEWKDKLTAAQKDILFSAGDDYENKKIFLRHYYLRLFLKNCGLFKLGHLLLSFFKK